MGDQVHGHRPGGLNLDVRLAEREGHLGVQGGVPVQDLADRLAGEPEPDPRAVDLLLAAGMIVHLDDHIAVPGKRAAQAVGELAGLAAGRPAAEVAVNLDAGTGEAGVARAGLLGVLLPRLALGIDIGQDVMHDPAVAGPVLDPRDVDVGRQAGRHHEAAVDVGAGGRDW